MSRTLQQYSPQEQVSVLHQAQQSALTLLNQEEEKDRKLQNQLDMALGLLRRARLGKPFKKRADKFIAAISYS